MPKLVKVNEEGRRIGESHPRAKLTDHEVDLLQQLIDMLIEEGKSPVEAYEIAAQKFELTAGYVRRVRAGERRCQTADKMKVGERKERVSEETLSPRRERFCEEYVKMPAKRGRAKAAAIAAGYSERAARKTASDLLTEPRVKRRIAE